MLDTASNRPDRETSDTSALQLAGQLGRDLFISLVHSAIESPINGASQLVEHIAGRELVPDLNIAGTPDPVEFGSARWHAQTIGGAAGMMVPFFFLNKGVGRLMNRGGLVAAETLPLSSRLAQAGLSGAIYDGVFHPVVPQDGEFWSARARNAVTGAATFATLASVSEKIPKKGVWNLNSVSLATAGIPAGIVNAQMKSLLAGKGLASGQDTYQSVYGFVFGGAALGVLNKAAELQGTKTQKNTDKGQGIQPDGTKIVKDFNSNLEEHFTKVTTKPANEVIEETPGLGSRIRKPDETEVLTNLISGTETTVSPDGLVTTTYANGTVIEKHPDGMGGIKRIVTRNPDGETIEEGRGAPTVITRKDGTVIEKHRDAHGRLEGVVKRKPDGEVSEIDTRIRVTTTTKPDGTVVIKDWSNPDGTINERRRISDEHFIITTTKPDGTKIVEDFNRNSEEHHTVITTKPDGEVIEEYKSSGRTLTKKTDGTVLVERKDGRAERPDLKEIFWREGESTVTLLPGGTLAREYDHGGKMIEWSDGTTFYESFYGLTQVVRPDPRAGEGHMLSITRSPNGAVTEESTASGLRITREPDGTVVEQTLSGLVTSKLPDGTIIVQHPDGGGGYKSVVTSKPNGEVIEQYLQRYEDGPQKTVTKRPDGEVVEELQEVTDVGVTVLCKPEGKLVELDALGYKVIEKQDGTAIVIHPDGTAREYSNGRSI